jgi:hypothetical protein
MKYKLNQKDVEYTAEGRVNAGDETILLHQAIDLSKGKTWASDGFTIEPLYNTELFRAFNAETRYLLISLWKKSGLAVMDDFNIDQYHHLATAQEQHLAAVEKTKLIPTSEFPLTIRRMEERMSEICKTPLIAKNPFDHQSVFHFRVVRPNTHDNNPLHRDVWLEDYSNCINLYIPVAGSNRDSSLSIVPGSHHWPENKVTRTEAGAIIKGVKFNVPAVTEIKTEYQMVRPDPKENEVLVFSPYLIHGGAANLNDDQTRISIELRLWKKD